MSAKCDEQDQIILNDRIARRAKLGECTPLVGDWVIFPDSHHERISHDWWGESLQTSHGGSFHLCKNGNGDFSGGLNSAIARQHFSDTGVVKEAYFWFFHHGFSTAHNGVDVYFPVKVWKCDVLRKNDFDDSFRFQR